MRVAYVVSRFPVVTETFVVRELNGVDAQDGVELELFSLFPAIDTTVQPSASGWMERVRPGSAMCGLRATAWWLCRRPLALLGAVAAVTRAFAAHPSRLARSLVTVMIASDHARTMRRLGVEHVHAHFANYPALAAWTASRLAGPTYSFTAHAHDIFRDQSFLARLVADARFVVTISDYNVRFISSHAPASTPMHVVHCGIDPSLWGGRLRAPPHEGPVRALCVASLERKKGHHVLLEALAGGGERLARVELDLVGPGALRGELEALTRRLGLAARVRFHGALPEPEVAALLDRADLFVLASIVERSGFMEGIPVALVEALAAGVPVLATRLSGVPELVRDGETGLLAEPDDAASLQSVLGRMLDDPDAALTRAAAGRALVEREFDVRESARRMTDLLRGGSQASYTRDMGGEAPSRQVREREFHNETFATDGRARASKFYAIHRASRVAYDRVLHDHPEGLDVLELGCGQVSAAFDLAAAGARVTAIDISDVAIAQATVRAADEGLSERLTFRVMDAERLEFAEGSFDLVCGTAIIHHLALPRAYEEIARMLRPGGRGIFIEALGHNPLINLYRRRTPDLRTVDEHPLLVGDIELARRHFAGVCVQYFHLATLAALPLIDRRPFEAALTALERADRALFRRVPYLRRHAWMAVLELTR